MIPTDSAARKALPLHSGCFAFFPAAWPDTFWVLWRQTSLREDHHYAPITLYGRIVSSLLRAPHTTDGVRDMLVLMMELARRQLGGGLAPADAARAETAPEVLHLYVPVFAELVRLAIAGNIKHCGGDGRLRHRRGVSADHLDAAARHVIDALGPEPRDAEDGILHAAKAAWRYAAWLQEQAEASGEPIAPAAEFA